MKNELVIVLDFGGQYNQLVARRVRECNVYCEIYSYKTPLEKIKEMNPKGIILTGGPNSCYLEDSPTYSKELFELGIPVLGLCYGAQLMQHVLGGKVERADVREYGKSILLVDQPQSKILKGVPETSTVWMSHFDYISKIAPGFEITTHTKDCPVASCEDKEKDLYAIQFHPEVLHSEYGKTMLSNFVLDVCNCAGDWRMDSFVEEQIKAIKEKVGDGKVLCALSGGVDSSVVAALLIKAIGQQLVCVHVNHGLLRKGEPEQVIEVFRNQMNANLVYVDATDRFLDKLAGVDDPEKKRKIIGGEFIEVFAEEARKLDGIEFLAQGTIWPDILESEEGIKAHHNAGGLPEDMDFELVEPVRILFKDEVRVVGDELGLPHDMVYRQPFPGPGLGVRCPGAITRDRLEAVRESDAILREEFDKNGLAGKIWQYFTVVPEFRSTGIKNGKRAFEWCCIVRAVCTTDVMTATVAELPHELMVHITDRITHEVAGINRVLYDFTPKPTGTVEFE